jgi:hypothetical protein
MRAIPLLLVLAALGCKGDDAPRPVPQAAAPATPRPPLPASLDRVGDLLPAPLGAALPACATAQRGLADALGPLAPAVAAARAGGPGDALIVALGRAADGVERVVAGDVDLDASLRELAASLRDLAGGAASTTDATARIDNAIDNAAASVAKLAARCADPATP